VKIHGVIKVQVKEALLACALGFVAMVLALLVASSHNDPASTSSGLLAWSKEMLAVSGNDPNGWFLIAATLSIMSIVFGVFLFLIPLTCSAISAACLGTKNPIHYVVATSGFTFVWMRAWAALSGETAGQFDSPDAWLMYAGISLGAVVTGTMYWYRVVRGANAPARG